MWSRSAPVILVGRPPVGCPRTWIAVSGHCISIRFVLISVPGRSLRHLWMPAVRFVPVHSFPVGWRCSTRRLRWWRVVLVLRCCCVIPLQWTTSVGAWNSGGPLRCRTRLGEPRLAMARPVRTSSGPSFVFGHRGQGRADRATVECLGSHLSQAYRGDHVRAVGHQPVPGGRPSRRTRSSRHPLTRAWSPGRRSRRPGDQAGDSYRDRRKETVGLAAGAVDSRRARSAMTGVSNTIRIVRCTPNTDRT